MTNFGLLDWIIVFIYLSGSVFIGYQSRKYVKNMSDFVVAGRSLGRGLGIATMIGSELGLITVMYAAQKGLTGGFASFHIALLAGLVCLIVGWTGYIVVPLRKLGVMTIPEFYEKRFSRGVRILGGAILALSGILNMGMFLNAGGTFIVGVTGMDSDFHLKIVMSILLILVLFYTMLGGMFSIVVTDFIQFVVLSIGLLIATFISIKTLGWEHILKTAESHYGDAGFNPLHADGFGIDYVVWMAFMGLISCAVWQTAVMRACAAKDTNTVKKIYKWSSIGFLARFLIPNFLGICAVVYFTDNLIPMPENTLQAFPQFLAVILPTGILGLVVAGMLAAFMSTHDSYLLCWSSVLTEDVINPLYDCKLKDALRLKITRIIIFLIGIFLLIWSLWYPLGQDLWDYMAISGAIYFTGAFALLGVGLYWKKASTTGAYLAILGGLSAMSGLGPIKEKLGPSINSLSSAELGLFTIALSVTLLILGSIFFPDKKNNIQGVR
tara:strand:- start:34 stop:1518 length:1485 start_codon:yes stop_codon:yes gene_type:complete